MFPKTIMIIYRPKHLHEEFYEDEIYGFSNELSNQDETPIIKNSMLYWNKDY